MEKYIRNENTGMVINKDDTEYQNFVRDRTNRKKFRELKEIIKVLESRIRKLEENNE